MLQRVSCPILPKSGIAEPQNDCFYLKKLRDLGGLRFGLNPVLGQTFEEYQL